MTGSGKTGVYLKLIDEALKNKKDVIVMVPEISLTPQLLSVFKGRFGDSIAVFHSRLSLGERLDEWKRVKRGEAKIAVGTRSAVFVPLRISALSSSTRSRSTHINPRLPRGFTQGTRPDSRAAKTMPCCCFARPLRRLKATPRPGRESIPSPKSQKDTTTPLFPRLKRLICGRKSDRETLQ